MNHPTSDKSIPLLTEKIDLSSHASEHSKNAEISDSLSQLIVETNFSASVDKSIPITEKISTHEVALEKQTFRQQRNEMQKRLLYELHQHLDDVLEQRVRHSINEMLQIAVESISEEIKLSLNESLKEAVAKAVEVEINMLNAKDQRF